MKNRSLEIAESYFTGVPRHPFDQFYHAYYQKKTEDSERHRAQALVALTSFLETVQDRPLMYRPGSISGGWLPHKIVVAENKTGRLPQPLETIHKIENTIGSERFKREILGPNKTAGLIRAQNFQIQFPDRVIIEPLHNELTVRVMTQDPAFSRKRGWEEEVYMGLWFPVVDHCTSMGLNGDWHFSRNSIWEVARGLWIQAGIVPTRPNADMDIYDIHKNPVTLLDRATLLADYVKWSIPNGIKAKEGATALAQMFTLDTWLRTGQGPQEFDMARAHPILRDRPQEEADAMTSLRKEMAPLLKKYCASYMIPDGLDLEFQQAIAAADPRKSPKSCPKWLWDEANRVAAETETLMKAAPVRLDTSHLTAQRRYNEYKDPFSTEYHAEIFEDRLFDKCDERERVGIRFALGGIEIPSPPAEHPYMTLVLYDMKRGQRALDLAKELGIDNVADLPGAIGSRRFKKDVEDPNWTEAEDFLARRRTEHPHELVLGTPNFLRISDAVDKNPNYVVAPGDQKWDSLARNALIQKALDRNVDRVYFMDGWESSDNLVQHMTRAVMIQAGLFERPSGEDTRLSIHNLRGDELSLFEVTKTLADHVERMVKKDVQVIEPALALARLFDIHDRLMDESYNRGLVVTSHTHPGMTAYLLDDRKKEMQQLRTKFVGITKIPGEDPAPSSKTPRFGLLLTECARYIPRERLQDLNPWFEHQHRKLRGTEEVLTERRSQRSSITRIHRKGPVR